MLSVAVWDQIFSSKGWHVGIHADSLNKWDKCSISSHVCTDVWFFPPPILCVQNSKWIKCTKNDILFAMVDIIGYVNTLMSWKAMIPLSRLTYCGYLVHPILMEAYFFSRRTPMYFTDFSMVRYLKTLQLHRKPRLERALSLKPILICDCFPRYCSDSLE